MQSPQQIIVPLYKKSSKRNLFLTEKEHIVLISSPATASNLKTLQNIPKVKRQQMEQELKDSLYNDDLPERQSKSNVEQIKRYSRSINRS